MSQPVPFHSLNDPLSQIVEKETAANAADIFCPIETCRCLVIRKGAAKLVERQGNKLSLPDSLLPANALKSQEEETQFWQLSNMMQFENVGFSKTVGTIKYLSCADCDVGPIGYHDTESGPKEFLISVRRARYRFQ